MIKIIKETCRLFINISEYKRHLYLLRIQMRIFAASILTILILTQIFSKWLLVAEYEINKEFIAKNLCVNKEKPKLKCHGKCQLMKKMAEETDNSNPGSGNGIVKNNMSEAIAFQDLSNFFVPVISSDKIIHNSFYLLKSYTAPVAGVFHPPLG